MRLQFGLRTLLATMLLACVVLGVVKHETRRADGQRELAQQILRLNGACERKPRTLIPRFVRSRLPTEYAETISEVSFGGKAAPSWNTRLDLGRYARRIASTRTLARVARLPAMRYVEKALLCGTSVDDDLADYVSRLPSMKSVVVDASTVSNSEYYPGKEETIKSINHLLQEHSPQERNGPDALSNFHSAPFELTENLQLFARAYEEDAEAIQELLDEIPKRATDGRVDIGPGGIALAVFHELTSAQAIEVLRKAKTNQHPSIRWVAVMFFESRDSVPDLIDAAYDPHPIIRRSAVGMLMSRQIHESDRQSVVELIRVRMTDDSEDIRSLAIAWWCSINRDGCFDLLKTALNDEASLVRATAVICMGNLGDQRAIPMLERAKDDVDSLVRGAAQKSLRELKR